MIVLFGIRAESWQVRAPPPPGSSASGALIGDGPNLKMNAQSRPLPVPPGDEGAHRLGAEDRRAESIKTRDAANAPPQQRRPNDSKSGTNQRDLASKSNGIVQCRGPPNTMLYGAMLYYTRLYYNYISKSLVHCSSVKADRARPRLRRVFLGRVRVCVRQRHLRTDAHISTWLRRQHRRLYLFGCLFKEHTHICYKQLTFNVCLVLTVFISCLCILS